MYKSPENDSKDNGVVDKIDCAIEYLTAKGALVNQKDKYGLAPLHYAAMRGNMDATQELLECEGVDIEASNDGGRFMHKGFFLKKSLENLNSVPRRAAAHPSPFGLHLRTGTCGEGTLGERVSLVQCIGDQVSIFSLISRAKIESMGEKKQTSLHKACAVGDETLVKMVIDCTVQLHGDQEVTRQGYRENVCV